MSKIDHKRIFKNSQRLFFAPLVGAFKEVRAEMRRIERQRNADQRPPAKEGELVDTPAVGG